MNGLAILVAAGRGERMGAGRPKAFLSIGGKTILLRAALAFEAAASIDAIVVVVPFDQIREAAEALQSITKLHAVVAGGALRQDSVLAGMKGAPDGFDAKRPAGSARACRTAKPWKLSACASGAAAPGCTMRMATGRWIWRAGRREGSNAERNEHDAEVCGESHPGSDGRAAQP